MRPTATYKPGPCDAAPSCNDYYALGFTHYCPRCLALYRPGETKDCKCREPLAEMLIGVVAGEHYDRIPEREGCYGQRRVA